VTYAMGKDDELPAIFGFLHGRFRTPHMAIIILVVLSAIVGSYGSISSDTLIQVILISNIGTFLLYGMTCAICMIAFSGVTERNVFSTLIAPLLGLILNVAMLIGVLYYAIVGATNTKMDSIIAGSVSIAFLVLGFIFLFGRQAVTGIRVLHPEDYKVKKGLVSGEPEVSVEAGGD
jgi:APA family basic amino acid/polyamine antiporter